MMVNVDALLRYYGAIITAYVVHAHRHSVSNHRDRPLAYINDSFHNSELP